MKFSNPFNRTKKSKENIYVQGNTSSDDESFNSDVSDSDYPWWNDQIPDSYNVPRYSESDRTSFSSDTSLDYPGDSEYIRDMDLNKNKINALDMDFESFKKYNKGLKAQKMQEKNKITKEKIEKRYPMSFGKVKDCSKMDISVIKNPKELHSRYHACGCTKQFLPSKKCKEIKNKFKDTLRVRNSERDDYIRDRLTEVSYPDDLSELDSDEITLGGKRKRRRKSTLKKRRSKKTQKRHQSKRKATKSKKNQKKRH
jgi:hypothetical protein